MKLPDFLEFEPFNTLRNTMSADNLGDFVFFDPRKNLTGLERIELEHNGLTIKPECLYTASDFTLVYKNSRVLIYTPPAGDRHSPPPSSGTQHSQHSETSTDQHASQGQALTAHIMDEGHARDRHFHIANCDTVRRLRELGALDTYRARTSNLSIDPSESATHRICPNCLQTLRYKDYDAVRQRHREYSQRIQEEFSIREFFQRYPLYPVEIKEDAPIF